MREHLSKSVEVVGFELGASGSLHLGATISEVLAFYVAEQGEGVVWFYAREFASPHDRGATLWQTRQLHVDDP
ncbi:MAG: hypothetical protein NT062_17670 [Proteobacteria bacterium]|nr:hypothetical protein [Pseudomonadota bacterium]